VINTQTVFTIESLAIESREASTTIEWMSEGVKYATPSA